MFRKLCITILIILFGFCFSFAQNNTRLLDISATPNTSNTTSPDENLAQDTTLNKTESVIKVWNLKRYGAKIEEIKLDTALEFYHVYNPIFQRSISNTFTGNLGGAYLSNDFFSRKANSDFYFYKSFDAYTLTPKSVRYFNTTTPYTLLDYSQSENRNTKNETRFNVTHSQNVSPKFNFIFEYDQSRAAGHYQAQETKFHNISLATNYISDKFNSHFNFIFNRYRGQENGGLEPGQDLNKYTKTESYLVKMLEASSEIKNMTIFLNNEYKVGKNEVKVNEEGDTISGFRPITGFIHQFEYSGNTRFYKNANLNDNIYTTIYLDSLATNDTTIYNRITNVFQIKFYEAPERKFTFTKRAYIANDLISIKMPGPVKLEKEIYHNTYVGGGISRDEGDFWKWNVEGKFYITGFRSGQTELSAFINKPLVIGKDTTTLHIEGELNSIVPDYFVQSFSSNHYLWNNLFKNTNEMRIRSKVESQRYKLTLGMNYALLSNYIFNNAEALPQQAGNEMIVLSAYANKDFESRHWLIRTQVIWQKSSQQEYLHLPTFTGYMSFNYRTLWEKVMHTQIGFDIRYNSEFYADAYDPATGQFYWQNQQKIGNFPFIDAHVNLKLKRTRAFFQLLNAASGLLNGNFWAAPDYPLYRRTFRLGVAWSFYD